MTASTDSLPTLKHELSELPLLFEISQILDRSIDLRRVVEPMLEAMAKHMGISRAVINLLKEQTGAVNIDYAWGMTLTEQQRGVYQLGEGITGRVVQDGQPVVVPRVSRDPEFLNRTRARREKENDSSFVCVPIRVDNAVLGAFSVEWPYDETRNLADEQRRLSVIASMVGNAVRRRMNAINAQEKLELENARLQAQLQTKFKPSNIIGNSARMQEVFNLMAQVAGSNTTVLLRGESGTGKELFAHGIHYNSNRAGKPFVRVNCAALPESVIESELFGHEKGAFTGALAQRKGRFELAEGGTIFLDEIGDISLAAQARLLRVLQEKEFERVGGNKTLRADVRVIAATNRDLETAIREGKFREDLYYRLEVFPIHIPPLRERPGDLMLLTNHFIDKYNLEHNKQIKRVSTPAIDMLSAYHWPGNVRELENCVERAVLLSTDEVLHGHTLPPTLQTAEASGTASNYVGGLQARVEAFEHELIIEALKESRGNMAGAARKLGITERIMGLRIRKYHINPKRFRGEQG